MREPAFLLLKNTDVDWKVLFSEKDRWNEQRAKVRTKNGGKSPSGADLVSYLAVRFEKEAGIKRRLKRT